MSQQFILAPGEEFLQCPYNVAHQITNARMLTHLDKCRKSYLKSLGVDGQRAVMKVCQFNATHHVPKIELKMHEQNCPDKANVIRYLHHHNSQEANKYYESRRKEELGRHVKQERDVDEESGEWQKVSRHKDRDRHWRDRDGRGHSPPRHQEPTPGPSYSTAGIEEEDWEEESAGYQPGYDPKIKLKQEPVMYNPAGLTKSERKKFRQEVRSRHAARSLGEHMEFPLATDFEMKPDVTTLKIDEDKKPFAEASGTGTGANIKVERSELPEPGEVIDSDEDFVEVIDFNGQEAPSAAACSSKAAAAYLDIKPNINSLTLPTPSCLHVKDSQRQQQKPRRPSKDQDRGSYSRADGERGEDDRSPPTPTNQEEVADEESDPNYWPWPGDGSDIYPDDNDDFAGRDPYA